MVVLRRLLGVLALIPVMTALTVFGGGEAEQYNGEDFDKYSCATLRELQRVPTSYKGTKVRFIVRFHRAENLWAPFYTPFVPEDYIAFSGWAPEKKVWVKEDHLSDFPFLYMKKDSPDLHLVVEAPTYQVMELYSIVRNDFNNIPWIEVLHIVPCHEPILHDELLHHMIRGIEAVDAGRMEEGLGHLHEALHHDPPLDAAVDIHIHMAKAYVATGNWEEVCNHAHQALELCPHHPDAEGMLDHAEQMIHQPQPQAQPAPQPQAQPAPQPKTQPEPQPTPQPKAPEPPVAKAPLAKAPVVAPGVAAASVAPPAIEPPGDARPAPQPNAVVPEPVPAVAPAPNATDEFRQAVAERDRKIAELGQALEDARKATQDQETALRADVARLTDSLSAKHSELEKQVRVAVDLEGRLRDALAKLETASRESASSDARVHAAQQELAQARAKLDATESEKAQLAAALEAARKAPATGDTAAAETAAALATWQSQLAGLQKRVAELEAENRDLREKVAVVAALKIENDGLKKLIAGLTSRNGELEAAVKELQDRLAAAPAPTVKDDGQAAQAATEAAQAANEAASLLVERNEMAGRLETIGKEREDLVSRVQERESRIAEMQRRIHELEAEAQRTVLAARTPAAEAPAAIDPNAPPCKPRGRVVGFDCRPPEVVREEIRRYREWLAAAEKTPGAVEKAMDVEPELLEPGMKGR